MKWRNKVLVSPRCRPRPSLKLCDSWLGECEAWFLFYDWFLDGGTVEIPPTVLNVYEGNCLVALWIRLCHSL
jgi:hypothetical protein